MIVLSIEKVELLKNKIHVYKEKMRMASSCAIDVKKRVVVQKNEVTSSRSKEFNLENTFLPEEIN